jgi:hypothetical protein
VKVLIEPGRTEEFPAVVVLAAGGDLNRARALKEELEGRSGRKLPESLRAFSDLVEAHEKKTREAREKLESGLLVEQAKQIALLKELDAQSGQLRQQLETGEDKEAVLAQLEQLEGRHAEAVTALSAVRERIARKIAKIDASFADLERQLAEAGASPEAIEKALRIPKRGLGTLNLAQLELVTWMEDLVKRRKELAELVQLAKSDDFRQRRGEAREALKRLFGGT